MYFTTHPQYALRYSREPMCLILNYLIIANPYPVIHDDAPTTSNLTLLGKGNYKHYGSHYIPVVPYGDESFTADFRPPPIGNKFTIARLSLQVNLPSTMSLFYFKKLIFSRNLLSTSENVDRL